MRPLVLRLQASLLALLFVAGSLGLPEADAILDHQPGASARQGQVHLEGTDGCREHADHCALGRLLTQGRDMVHVAPAPAVAPVAAPCQPVPRRNAVRAAAATATCNSRAPPEPV